MAETLLLVASPGVPTTKKKNPHRQTEVRQHIVHLFVMDGSVGTGIDHCAERAAPTRRTSTLAEVKGDKPGPRYKWKKRKGFLGRGHAVCGPTGVATPGRPDGNVVGRGGKSWLREKSTTDQLSVEQGYVLPDFATMQASRCFHLPGHPVTLTKSESGSYPGIFSGSSSWLSECWFPLAKGCPTPRNGRWRWFAMLMARDKEGETAAPRRGFEHHPGRSILLADREQRAR